MSVESFVIIAENPLSSLPIIIGTGPVVGGSLDITTPGVVDTTSLHVPPGVDLTIQLWGGGAGGGTGNVAPNGGGGGGGGGYAAVTVPADLWADGGTITIAATAAGGASPPQNGFAGNSTILTLNSVAQVTCHGGAFGHTSSGVGSNGGTVVIGGTVIPITSATGGIGGANPDPAGSVGGKGAGPSGGAGGAGGVGTNIVGSAGTAPGGGGGGGSSTTGHGGAGASGRCLISW